MKWRTSRPWLHQSWEPESWHLCQQGSVKSRDQFKWLTPSWCWRKYGEAADYKQAFGKDCIPQLYKQNVWGCRKWDCPDVRKAGEIREWVTPLGSLGLPRGEDTYLLSVLRHGRHSFSQAACHSPSCKHLLALLSSALGALALVTFTLIRYVFFFSSQKFTHFYLPLS